MFALEVAGNAPLALQGLWFILIAVLWIGYLVLEGFDYGVAMLIPFLGKTEKEKRVIVNTIGPVWDGNEVWLLTAGGATFAAFPAWYATLFSGLYLPLFLVLVGLIIRGVAFEYRSKHPEAKWRNAFDWMASIGSFVVTLVFGVGFANFILGLPVAAAANNPSLYVVTPSPYFWQLFSWFGLLGGVCLVALFLFHGSLFLALKTKGEIHDRATAFAGKVGLVSIGLGAIFLVSQNLLHPIGPLGWVLLVLAALGLVSAWWFNGKGRDGIAFISTTATVLFVAVGIFATMWPGLGFKGVGDGLVPSPLTAMNASSSELTLTLMTVAACVFVPIVLAYTAWAYTVFRRRLGVENIPDDEPAPALAG
ncbi:MAG: cytochrome d ubiquinol oxidase subunit II [Actinobacteria bacterium]|nr:cytochrome d ubiquinol oxidase subunit II [Actinomycetota bacterium]